MFLFSKLSWRCCFGVELRLIASGEAVPDRCTMQNILLNQGQQIFIVGSIATELSTFGELRGKVVGCVGVEAFVYRQNTASVGGRKSTIH